MRSELLVGVSERPDFLVYERRFSDWGKFDHWVPTPNQPMQGAIEEFMRFAEFQEAPTEIIKPDSQLQTASSVGVEFTSRSGASNRLHLRVVEGQFLDSDRKIFHIGLPHFRQVMVFDTKNGPEMKFRRAEWLSEWVSIGGMRTSGALNYPAGPAQIEQYTDILKYTMESVETGSARITSKITTADL